MCLCKIIKKMCGNNYFVVCIFISIGTMIQTGFHLLCVVYGYYLNICKTSPKDPFTIFLYLTYFYRQNCGNVTLHNDPLMSFQENSFGLFEIVNEILNKSKLPENSPSATRVEVYLFAYLGLDCLWCMSGVALLMGASFKIKQICSLIFYGPWLILTILGLGSDLVATFHFALDIISTFTFSGWVNFVGIKNPSALHDLDDKNPSIFLPMAPSLTICLITSRFIVFWVMNFIGFCHVLKAAKLAYRDSYDNEPSKITKKLSDGDSFGVANDINLDSSAARIRNWQLFYGAVKARNSRSSSSNSSNSKRYNSLNRKRKKETIRFDTPLSLQAQDVDQSSQSSNSLNDANTYQAYPDVTDNVEECRNSYMKELRGQLPWSYFEKNEDVALHKIRNIEVIPTQTYASSSLPSSSQAGTEF